jgi:hypothetical protein
MSVNKFRPHIFVLPEDDANRQIANGFLLDPSLNGRAIQILEPAGGWQDVLNNFKNNQLNAMSTNPNRYMVLLLDFDQDDKRLAKVKAVIHESLAERVLVLGVFSEPEDLRKARLGNWEDIGRNLAKDCREGTTDTWNHELLQHNAEELQRMMPILKPILFP